MGFVEESEEVKAKRALREAARAYASMWLQSFASAFTDEAETDLASAAVAYAATQPKPRKAARAKGKP